MIVTNPFRPSTWTRELLDTVARGWWVLLISGVLSAVAGGIVLSIDWSIEDLATFVGALLIARGLIMLLSTPVDGAVRTWAMGVGVLQAAVGLAVWIWPGPTLLVIALFIGWWVLFSGAGTIAGAIGNRDVLPFWGVMLAFGILETLFAFWLLARPGLTLVAGVLAIGFWSLVSGVLQIGMAFEIKHLPARARQLLRDLEHDDRD